MTIWDKLGINQYVGLQPWVWVQLESADPPGPFPFMGGVDPEVVGSLHEVHGILMSSIETAISDVFSHRSSLDDHTRHTLLENAYAEVVESRPRLKQHVQCGRLADGTFQWKFPQDKNKSATMTYGGIRVFNAVKREAIPFGFERPLSTMAGKLLGFLNGSRTVSEVRTIATASGRDFERHLTGLMELLFSHECLTLSPRTTILSHWQACTKDRDMVHLGHAALLYRQQEKFLWFDPWLMPWFAESPVPSLWIGTLPSPTAIFLTHDHDDHVDPRTLYHVPKDTPIFVPSRKNRRSLFYDYLSLLRELGFTHVVEMAHGDTWKFEGGMVVCVPFYGEDPCDLALPRNCYLIVDRGHNTLVHADSGPTNEGESAIKNGMIAELVNRYGPISTIFASQQQLKEIRAYAAHACLSHPGQWFHVGENGFLTNQYLSELVAHAKAKLFFSYATGGADWYPDHLSFMFSHRNPARTALLTANWEKPESLGEVLGPQGCGYHYGQALDIVRALPDHQVQVVSSEKERLAPVSLYQLDNPLPSFLHR